ncbi:MAG: nucleoside triphosphate pyrophosphohydrolase, partial [Kangiellaceae bacterium]|nr:nucleoside triphosphate pyrophosphohydrolase [Kangiellaceae bacterium]
MSQGEASLREKLTIKTTGGDNLELAIDKLESLRQVMRMLRDPESGCPWDLKQSYRSITPYTLEEVYEVIDAIERDDFSDLKGELGDLLFQIIFYCQLAEENNHFSFNDVVSGIVKKLVSRHPHVFSNKTYNDEASIHKAWEDLKHQERQTKNQAASLMDDIPKVLPALKRAQKMQKRAAKQGFDWPSTDGVWQKISE